MFDLRLKENVGDIVTEVRALLRQVVKNDIGGRSTWCLVFGKVRWNEDAVDFRSDVEKIVVLVVLGLVPVTICGWDLTIVESVGGSQY